MEACGSAGAAEQQPAGCKNVPLHIQRKLRDVSESQWELAKIRKELLIKRQRVRTSSRSVQLKRVDAGDAEATFMNRLREFVNENRDQLPATLLDAYDKVEQTRNDLGENEENYLQAERDLTGAEWTFMDQENVFYQFDLLDIIEEASDGNPLPPKNDQCGPSFPPPPPPPFQPSTVTFDSTAMFPGLPPPPPPPPNQVLPSPGYSPSQRINDQEYHQVVAELDVLRKGFNELRQEQARRIAKAETDEIVFDEYTLIENDSSPFTAKYCELLDEITRREVKAQQLKMEDMQKELQASTTERRHSDPTHCLRHAPLGPASMIRAQTESAALIISKDPTTKNKIKEWLLTDLKANAVHKTLYLNTLERFGVASAVDGAWEDRATEYWSHDSSSSFDNDSTGTHDTSQEPDIEDDWKSNTEPQSGTPSLKDLLRLHPCSDHYVSETHISCKDSSEAEIDKASSIPLPYSPLLWSEHAAKTGPQIPFITLTTNDVPKQNEQVDGGHPLSADIPIVHQMTLEPIRGSNSSGRKDSCQSSNFLASEELHAGDGEIGLPKQSSIQEYDDQQLRLQNNQRKKDGYAVLPMALDESSTSNIRNTTTNHIATAPDDNLHATSAQSASAPAFENPWLHSISIRVTPPSRPTSEHGGQKSTRKRIYDFIQRTSHGRSLTTSFALGEHKVGNMES